MATTYTANLNLALQATGEDSGTWGSNLNADVFAILDNVAGAVQTISLSSTDVTLTTTQTQVATIKLNGTLTANVNLIFPAIGRVFFIQNSTAGAYTITLKITGSSGATAIAPANNLSGQFFILDGTNVYADFGGTPPGEVKMFAMSSLPYGWLLCDGTAKSRTTYAALFAAIGTTYGSGDGSTTFNLPNALGYFPRAWNGTGSGPDPSRVIGSAQTNAIQAHTHAVTDPGHSHTVPTWHQTGLDNHISSWASTNPNITGVTDRANTGITIQSTGGSETRPINIAFMFAIKW